LLNAETNRLETTKVLV